MEFGDKKSKCKDLKEIANKDWKTISNFILNSEKSDFRNQLNLVNSDLYLKLKNMAAAILNKRLSANGKRDAESNRASAKNVKSLSRQFTIKQSQFPSLSRRNESKEIIRPIINLKMSARKESSNEVIRLEIPNSNDKENEFSVISPLMKMMREKQANQEKREIRKQRRLESQSEFQKHLEEYPYPILNPIQVKAKSSVVRSLRSTS